MLQEIITYIIVLLTFGYVIFKTIKFFSNANKISKNSPCNGCSSGGCKECPFNQSSVSSYQLSDGSTQFDRLKTEN